MNAKGKNKVNESGVVYLDLPRPSEGTRNAFQGIGTADIAGVSQKTALLDASVFPVCTGSCAFGPAFTVINAKNDTLMLHYAVELCKEGDVLVITAEEGSTSALWGKMLTIVAQARGIAGVIIDGPVRDTAYIRNNKFPVWARSISPKGSQRKGAGKINTPVRIGDALINPGDLILADDDGIIAFPTAEAEQILEKSRLGQEKETTALPLLEKGVSPYKIWGMEKALKESGVKTFSGSFFEDKN